MTNALIWFFRFLSRMIRYSIFEKIIGGVFTKEMKVKVIICLTVSNLSSTISILWSFLMTIRNRDTRYIENGRKKSRRGKRKNVANGRAVTNGSRGKRKSRGTEEPWQEEPTWHNERWRRAHQKSCHVCNVLYRVFKSIWNSDAA